MTERLAALKAARLACRELDFWGRNRPKCPHCGYVYDIQEHGTWSLYEQGEHDIECPSCHLNYTVIAEVEYSYSTDEQDEDEE